MTCGCNGWTPGGACHANPLKVSPVELSQNVDMHAGTMNGCSMNSKRCATNLVMTVNAGHTNNSIMLSVYVVMHPTSQNKTGSCLCGHHSKLPAKRNFALSIDKHH